MKRENLKASIAAFSILLFAFPVTTTAQPKLTPTQEDTANQLLDCVGLLRPFWEEFVGFRDSETFEFYGFGVGGPHHQWLERIDQLPREYDMVCMMDTWELKEIGVLPEYLSLPLLIGDIKWAARDALALPVSDYPSSHLEGLMAWADEYQR